MIRTPQQLALFPVPLYCKAGRRPGPAGRCPAGRRPGPAGRCPAGRRPGPAGRCLAGRRPGNKSCRKVPSWTEAWEQVLQEGTQLGGGLVLQEGAQLGEGLGTSPAGRYPAGRRPGNKSCRKVQRQVSRTPLSYSERAYMFDGIDETEILKSIVIGDEAQGTQFELVLCGYTLLLEPPVLYR